MYKFKEFYIPKRMMNGIENWIQHGIEPGRFLMAVIENNLKEATGAADDENLKNIPAYVAYFYNNAPLACWGTPEKAEAWKLSFKRMPQAPKYLRNRWQSDENAMKQLDGKIQLQRLHYDGTILFNEGYIMTDDDESAVEYMILEWDYGFEYNTTQEQIVKEHQKRKG